MSPFSWHRRRHRDGQPPAPPLSRRLRESLAGLWWFLLLLTRPRVLWAVVVVVWTVCVVLAYVFVAVARVLCAVVPFLFVAVAERIRRAFADGKTDS